MNNVIALFPQSQGAHREQPVKKEVTKEQVIEHLAGLLLWQKANNSDRVCASSEYIPVSNHGSMRHGFPPSSHETRSTSSPTNPARSVSQLGHKDALRPNDNPAWQGLMPNSKCCS